MVASPNPCLWVQNGLLPENSFRLYFFGDTAPALTKNVVKKAGAKKAAKKVASGKAKKDLQ